MKIKTKALIVAAALLLSFIGFNLIASPAAVDLSKIGKKPAYQVTITVVADADEASSPNIIEG
jgi:hypothetical protein